VEYRVLVLTPKGRDAEVIRKLLLEQGREVVLCKDVVSLAHELEADAGAAVVTEEALTGVDFDGLLDWLNEQPPWSDFPFVLLTTRQVGRRSAAAQRVVDMLGNVVVLERPISAETLASAIDSALRARNRQYQTRTYLGELQLSRHALQQLNETLETRIAMRTVDLAHANDRLVTEIAERERAQAALVQSQKMEAIGQLTNGIAHDFNNLLTAIVGNVDMISRRSDDERIKRLAGYAHQAANRASRLTGQLLAFSRTQCLDLQPVSVDTLIDGMGDLMRRSIGPAIEIRIDLRTQEVLAVADPNQLELAVLNLIINARDAMPNGGTLTIATSIKRAEQAELLSGPYVVIAVADTGTGIPAHLLSKVFEPFFTTKPIGKGTGLGLSQVYGIAQQSGGSALVKSAPGKGTTVEIWLPISDSEHQAAARFTSSDPLIDIAHDETIVVVEDDGDVRRFMVECLQAFGYHVSEADNGHVGLDMLQRARPDLLIVDFAMPGMNGAEMAHQVRARYEDLPIIFVTGYADMEAVESVTGVKYLLKKPFEVAGLASVVRSALSSLTAH
jgi:signal transduction histidine kinase